MGRPILLPGGVFLPTASLGPATLLLPSLGLLLITLRLLLGTLLLRALLVLLLSLRRLLGSLLLALLILLLLLLGLAATIVLALLLLRRRLLGALVLALILSPMFVLARLPLLRWRWLVSPPVRFILLLPILVGLSVPWSNRPQKQKHRHSSDKNEFHNDHLRW